MRRTLIILAATALAAAIAIPAAARSGDDPAAQLTSCLAAHGVTVPSGLDGVALKRWIGAHQDDQALGAALQACTGGGPSPEVVGLSSCLKSHGVDVPGSPVAIKQKIGELSRTDAGKAALAACGLRIADKPAAGACRSGKPADTPAAKQDGS